MIRKYKQKKSAKNYADGHAGFDVVAIFNGTDYDYYATDNSWELIETLSNNQ